MTDEQLLRAICIGLDLGPRISCRYGRFYAHYERGANINIDGDGETLRDALLDFIRDARGRDSGLFQGDIKHMDALIADMGGLDTADAQPNERELVNNRLADLEARLGKIERVANVVRLG